MAEAVNCICHYCGQQRHKKPNCPIRRTDLGARGLNSDEVNDHNKRENLAQWSENNGNGVGGDGAVEANALVAMDHGGTEQWWTGSWRRCWWGTGSHQIYSLWATQAACGVTLCLCVVYRMPVSWTPCYRLPSPPGSKGLYGWGI